MVRVVDGDTIIVEPDHVVRLIGVDTPETVKPNHAIERFGPEATQFTKRFLWAGTARLTFDRERVDRFGRFLAYVWVGRRLLNEELLRAGLARFEPQFYYSELMKRRFRQAENKARRSRIGIWSPEPDSANSPPAVRSQFCRAAPARLPGEPGILPAAAAPLRFTSRSFQATTENDHGPSQTDS